MEDAPLESKAPGRFFLNAGVVSARLGVVRVEELTQEPHPYGSEELALPLAEVP